MSMPGFGAEAALTDRTSGSSWATGSLDRPEGRDGIHLAARTKPFCLDRYYDCMSGCSDPLCGCLCRNELNLCTGWPLEVCSW
jgi:hypothetical protein